MLVSVKLRADFSSGCVLGRIGTYFSRHTHKRRNIETAYSMIKGKFGSAGRSKSDTGQTNEALCKVLAHNVCVLIQAMHAFNVEPLFAPRNAAYLTAR
jgi:hypothetical protein